MEKSTWIGIFSGIFAIGLGMYWKGVDLSILLNPAAFLIIIIGTAASIFNAFPVRELKNFPGLLKIIFVGNKFISKQEVLELFVALAKTAKQEGVKAIEKKAEEVEDAFIRSALTMVADGFNTEFIYNVIDMDIKQMEERHRRGIKIFSQCGMYAPTLGILGAVVGLIAALSNLNDVNQLGNSIAAAFSATLLGIFTGYVCWHPFANKLQQLNGQEVEIKKMIMEGAVALGEGASSIAMEARLQAFIPISERKSQRDL